MNYSNFYPPVTRRIRYLFLLSYLLTYWWASVVDESSNLSNHHHFHTKPPDMNCFSKISFFNGLTPLVSEQTKRSSK